MPYEPPNPSTDAYPSRPHTSRLKRFFHWVQLTCRLATWPAAVRKSPKALSSSGATFQYAVAVCPATLAKSPNSHRLRSTRWAPWSSISPPPALSGSPRHSRSYPGRPPWPYRPRTHRRGPRSPAETSWWRPATAGWKRWLYPARKQRPLSPAAAATSATSTGLRPTGFSHSTCLPPRSAALLMRARASWVVATTTRSTSASATASSHLAMTRTPCAAARAVAAAAFVSQTAASRVFGCAAMASARLRPTPPQPMRATWRTAAPA